MAIIQPVPPAFPVPVLPQVFDTSLSYYELLAKLTETINTVVIQVNTNTASIETLTAAVENIGEITTEINQLSADLAAETAARIAGDNSLAGQISAWAARMETEFPTYEDLETDYIVGGVSFEYITKAEYDELTEYVAKRVYIVDDDGNISMIFHETTTDDGEPITGRASAYSGGARQVGQRAGASIIGYAETV